MRVQSKRLDKAGGAPFTIMASLAALAGVATVAASGWAIAQDGDPYAAANATREAFSQPLPQLRPELKDSFARGRALFRQNWVIAPSSDEQADGLGPFYNRISCVACHAANGKGHAPDAPGERAASLLVRLSVPGTARDGGPLPHPAYGEQFREGSIPGVPAPGRLGVDWRTHKVTLAGGEQATLRAPVLRFHELAYGPMGPVRTSARIGPSVFGLGLLEAVPAEFLQALARERKPDGIRGKINRVPPLRMATQYQPERDRSEQHAPAPPQPGFSRHAGSENVRRNNVGSDNVGSDSGAIDSAGSNIAGNAGTGGAGTDKARAAVGRFGLKANQGTLRGQIASAMANDLGISSSLLPQQQCTAAQRACRQAAHGGTPELTDRQLDDLQVYLSFLAPPAPRGQHLQQVKQGKVVFTTVGCAACHRPSLPVGSHPLLGEPAGAAIAPYTDLLLHDMGPGLADGRPDFSASGREWRTAPLWGAGLLRRMNERAGYLHDDRARNPQEAILWHGGEAAAAQRRYVRLPALERAALLAFIESL